VSDIFPATLECLFRVPESVKDKELRDAVNQLAETLKSDLLAVGAPVEVLMEASAAINQFAKHMQASRVPYGFPELGGYTDPGSERAALSSLNTTLTALRDAMTKLRIVRANPEQLQAALAERDAKFITCVQALQQRALAQSEPVGGTDLQFWLQSELFPLLRSEGLVE
jgi:hypothetical protein